MELKKGDKLIFEPAEMIEVIGGFVRVQFPGSSKTNSFISSEMPNYAIFKGLLEKEMWVTLSPLGNFLYVNKKKPEKLGWAWVKDTDGHPYTVCTITEFLAKSTFGKNLIHWTPE